MALIDLEWAFDSVWRNGVLYKLWKVGIRGRMLISLHSFLTNRFSRSLVNSHCSEWIQTDIGVPQGSLLAVILFIFHIHDMAYNIPSKIKFADDINVLSTNRDPAIAASVVQSSLTEIVSWNNKWRLFLGKDETKIICFSKNTHHEVDVILDQHKIEQVSSKLCLGVVLDENLHFSKHISYACSKAIKALNKVCIFLSNTDGLNTRNSIILYKSLVRPHLEYAYSVWASVNKKDLIKIDRVQRTALLKASGCLNSTPTSALDVLTNVLPISLRLQELLCYEYVRTHMVTLTQVGTSAYLGQTHLETPFQVNAWSESSHFGQLEIKFLH